ncbi:hypothetical protein ACH5RR_013234 [Cinchona calisaya]|uniref:Uncharacterized protein n=1 Tax=Cinchona calisaya TaxID=153742 RepID=A0ABD2ZZK6_9GENT
MGKDSWKARERATKISDGKKGTMKQVKKPPKEDASHDHYRPCLASLFEFFPKGYFGQVNKIASSFMVISRQEIATGELSAQEETDLAVHIIKGLPTWLNLSEAIQLPEEDRKALVKVLEDPSKIGISAQENFTCLRDLLFSKESKGWPPNRE